MEYSKADKMYVTLFHKTITTHLVKRPSGFEEASWDVSGPVEKATQEGAESSLWPPASKKTRAPVTCEELNTTNDHIRLQLESSLFYLP